jgi:hypothetical protein
LCPHCGAQNPDYVMYCGSCGRPARESMESGNVQAMEGSEPPSTPPPSPEGRARPEAASLPVTKLNMAAIAAVASVVLLVVGLLLYVYYYEGVMDPDRDIERLMDLFDIAKYSMYARYLGEVFGALCAVLVVHALMTGGLAAASAAARQIRLGNIMLILVTMAILLAVVLVTTVYIYEAEPDLSETAGKVISRIVIYLPWTGVVLAAIALLIVTFALRTASLGGRAASFAESAWSP